METHVEPFVHLVDVRPDTALVAWGAFWFERRSESEPWRIVDDERLPDVAGRTAPIGREAEPYGAATVEILRGDEVVASASTDDRCWVHVQGLQPDTDYRYRVLVDGEEWAAGERWDWVPAGRGGYDLQPAGRQYELAFRTPPAPDVRAPLTFAVLGDYGVGVVVDAESSRRQRRIAEVLEQLVVQHDARLVVTTGDNVYRGERQRVGSESGGEDDDWYSSFYAPYRYVIARVPVYPAVGNHDASDSESSDDRRQMCDNFHTATRFTGVDGRSSVDPGLYYRVDWGADVELVCVDSSEAGGLSEHRFFQHPKHAEWLRAAFGQGSPRWRIPFTHHPAYCAGPHHRNDDEVLEHLVPLYRDAGVRLVLAGHEHNFQISEVDGMTHVLAGAGGQLREDLPTAFEEAHTSCFQVQSHALLVEIDGDEARITPYSGTTGDGRLEPMSAQRPDGSVVFPPFVVTR